MKRRCDAGESWEEKRARIIGLGEASLHKSYYPELRQRVAELERFRGLLDHAGDGIFLIQTPSGRVVDANEAAAELLGRARDALLAASIADLLPDPAGAAVAALCAGERREEAPGLTIAVPLARGDGSVLHLEVSARPVVFRREVYVVAVARDTSERRRLEEQLQQAQKMEAIGQLAGGMAHDFNNILTGILGNVELLAEELRRPGSDPAAWLEEVGRIEQGARRAAALTRQILLVSRRDVVRPADVDLNRTVICMREMLRRVIPEHTALDVDLAEDLRPVRADQGQIEQVVMNLVLNARDAMPRGGTLALATANVDVEEEGDARWAGARPGPHAALIVRDTGTGMDRGTIDHIFEPFFTTKPPGQGTGLGLAVVYGIVTRWGGRVAVESAPGAGSTFRVLLPASARRGAESDVPSGSAPAPAGGETVLVCEDDAEVRRLATDALQRGGYTVLAAAHGQEALDLASSCARRIDLLVTDVIMPQMDGRRLAEHLAARVPGIRTLFISGYAADLLAREDGLGEGTELLEKPFSGSALLESVRRLLDRPGGRRS